jgi:uncharacterized protein DUF6703
MRRKLPMMIGAPVIGAIFAAGLFIRSWFGGVLLLVTDGALISLAMLTWPQLRPRDKLIRVIVMAAIAMIAVAKIAG